MKRLSKILKFIGVSRTVATPYSVGLEDYQKQYFQTTYTGAKCRLLPDAAVSSHRESVAVRGAKSNLQEQIDAVLIEIARAREELDQTKEVLRLTKAYDALIKDSRRLYVKVDAVSQVADDLKKIVGELTVNELPLAESVRTLGTSKISTGSDIVLSGRTLKTDLAPADLYDVANKAYVDNMAFGIRWAKEVQVCTSENIELNGLKQIDGYALSSSDRVLVKDQHDRSQNGVYFASNGSWTKISGPMYSTVNTGVFVERGESNRSTCWVRLPTDEFAKISNPIAPSSGIGLQQKGTALNIDTGPGIAVDKEDGVSAAIHSHGGLMYTVDNRQPVTKISKDRKQSKLALTKTGVVKGQYGTDLSIGTAISVDDTGRITDIRSMGPVTPSFASITNLPSTLSGYGIDDALSISGGTLLGSLQFSSGAMISNYDHPTLNAASISTTRYGKGGDKRTHFGYNEAGIFMNYVRGDRTEFEGELHLTSPGTEPFIFTTKSAELSVHRGERLMVIDSNRRAVFAQAPKTVGYSKAVLKQMFAEMSVDLQNIKKYAPDAVIHGDDGQMFIDVMFVLRCLPGLIDGL